jgi:hypothetical protein
MAELGGLGELDPDEAKLERWISAASFQIDLLATTLADDDVPNATKVSEVQTHLPEIMHAVQEAGDAVGGSAQGPVLCQNIPDFAPQP